MELFCEDDEVVRATRLIRKIDSTGQAEAGWIFVSVVEAAYRIDDGHHEA